MTTQDLSHAMATVTGEEVWRFGFAWGPMTVTRLAHIVDRGYVLEIATEHKKMQIHVTEKGHKIKAFPEHKKAQNDIE